VPVCLKSTRREQFSQRKGFECDRWKFVLGPGYIDETSLTLALAYVKPTNEWGEQDLDSDGLAKMRLYLQRGHRMLPQSIFSAILRRQIRLVCLIHRRIAATQHIAGDSNIFFVNFKPNELRDESGTLFGCVGRMSDSEEWVNHDAVSFTMKTDAFHGEFGRECGGVWALLGSLMNRFIWYEPCVPSTALSLPSVCDHLLILLLSA